MRLEDTYNLHKKINCILPFFKSKKLCKKGIHNYVINHKHYVIPHTELKDDGYRVIAKTIRCEHRDLINLKCICCGKEKNWIGGIMNIGDNRWHKKYVCDKCGAVIPYIGQKGYRDNLYHHYVSTSNQTAHKDFDLCGSCEKKIRIWLNTREILTAKEIIDKFPIWEEE